MLPKRAQRSIGYINHLISNFNKKQSILWHQDMSIIAKRVVVMEYSEHGRSPWSPNN